MTGDTIVTTGAKVLDVLGYRRMLRLERPFERPAPELEPRSEIRVGIAGLEEYLELGHPTARTEAERRLGSGGRILGVWREGRLASASWLAEGSVYVPYLRVDLQLPDDELYQYDLWTQPRQRGALLTSYRFPWLVSLGRDEAKRVLVCHIWPEHRQSLGSAYRKGYDVVGLATAVRLPGRIVYRERRWDGTSAPHYTRVAP